MMKSKSFTTAAELCAFRNDASNSVTTVVSIVYDTINARFVMFWT